MSKYRKSKSQKRSSQSQSKNGGRRRKNTMRKLRRGRKSRKVIRGGTTSYVMYLSDKSQDLYNRIRDDNNITDQAKLREFLNRPEYKFRVNLWYKQLFDVEPAPELDNEAVKNEIIKKLEEGDQ